MAHLTDIFTLEELEQEIADGYVTRRPNSDGSLLILNYAPSAAYDRRWNAVTLASRGLIADADGNIVARPFAKFFNYGDIPLKFIPTGKPAIVTPKMDGSLGIGYRHNGGYFIATRGSFGSEQALWASEFWGREYAWVRPPAGTTPLFEIIYPSNRIVVNYAGLEALVLLAVIDNETGADVPLYEAEEWWPGPAVPIFQDTTSLDAAHALGTSNEFEAAEGVVLCWPNFKAPSMRLKVKHPEYCRLHRIVTGVSARTVWKALSEDRPLNDLLDNVPDEFNAWVRSQISLLTNAHSSRIFALETEFACVLADTPGLVARFMVQDPTAKKDFAAAIKKHPDKSYLFALWDGKPIRPAVWSELRPGHETPFTTDDEG